MPRLGHGSGYVGVDVCMWLCVCVCGCVYVHACHDNQGPIHRPGRPRAFVVEAVAHFPATSRMNRLLPTLRLARRTLNRAPRQSFITPCSASCAIPVLRPKSASFGSERTLHVAAPRLDLGGTVANLDTTPYASSAPDNSSNVPIAQSVFTNAWTRMEKKYGRQNLFVLPRMDHSQYR